jgi:hypothetical protein
VTARQAGQGWRILAPVLLACVAGASPAEWTSWSLGPGSAPAVTPDGSRVVYLRSLAEGWALVSCTTDGAVATSHVGARSTAPDVGLTDADTAAPVALAEGGNVALVGGRLLVLLTGRAAALAASVVPATAPVREYATASDGAALAALLEDGSLWVVRPSAGPSPRRIALPGAATSLALSADGSRLLVRGETRSWVLETDSGAVLLELPAPLSALSGDGRRYAYVAGDTLHRLALGRPEGTPLPAPSTPVRSIALDKVGRGIYLQAEGTLWRLDWAGEQFRPVVALAAGARYSLSADGRVVAYEEAGEVHVASADRAEPPPPTEVRFETPRRLPSLDSVLPELVDLAHRIAQDAGADASPSGLVARAASTGWGLFRQADPPVSIRVPPEWRVEPREDGQGLTLVGLDHDEFVELLTLRGADADPAAWAASISASRGWGELPAPADSLLGGVEGVTWHVAIGDTGDTALIAAARWADGLVGVVARFAGQETPPDVRSVVESISLEPWGRPAAPSGAG